MSPSAKRASYRMEYFNQSAELGWQEFYEQKNGGYYLDLPGYNKDQATKSGVPADNINISPVDSAQDSNYFSHYQGEKSGRFATVAMLSPQL